MKKRIMVVLFALTLLPVTSLIEKAGWAQKLTPVKVAIIPIVDMLPAFLGKDKGYFKEEGLDVEIAVMRGGAEILFATAGGSVQAGIANLGAVVMSWEKGFDYVVLAPTTYIDTKTPATVGLAARKDSGINSYKDLEGKTVAVNELRSIGWLYLAELMVKAGGNPDAVNWVELPFPVMVGQILNRRIDAAHLASPFTDIARGNPELMIVRYHFMELNPAGLMGAYVTTKTWAEKNTDLAKGLARGLDRAVDYINSNPGELPALIAKFAGIKEEMAKNIALPVWKRGINMKDVQWYVDMMLKHGLIKKKIEVKGRLFQAP